MCRVIVLFCGHEGVDTRFCLCQNSQNQPDTTKRELDSMQFFLSFLLKRKDPSGNCEREGWEGQERKWETGQGQRQWPE